MQLITSDHVSLGVRCGKDDGRDRLQTVVVLDERENLPPIHLSEDSNPEDEVRAGGVGVDAFTPQKCHGLDTVRRNMQMTAC